MRTVAVDVPEGDEAAAAVHAVAAVLNSGGRPVVLRGPAIPDDFWAAVSPQLVANAQAALHGQAVGRPVFPEPIITG